MQALLTGRVRVRPHDVWACIRHIHLRIRFNKYIESLLWNQVGDWECGRDPGPAVLGGGTCCVDSSRSDRRMEISREIEPYRGEAHSPKPQ
jgi:hypothetical protein